MLVGLNSEQDSGEQLLPLVQSLPTCSREYKRVRDRENRPERRGTSYDMTPRSGLFSHAHTPRKVYSPRCDNTTTIANTVLVQEDSLCNGVHSTGQATQAQRVQVLWCGSQSSLAICAEAFLHPCRHQMFSHVDGVSAVTYRPCALLTVSRPNLVSMMFSGP